MDTTGAVDLAARRQAREDSEAHKKAGYWAEKLADQVPWDMSYAILLISDRGEDRAVLKSNLEGEDLIFLLRTAADVVDGGEG